MDKDQIKEALSIAKENSKKRNFKQSIDLIRNFKGINLKKTEEQLELFIPLHFERGKKVKVCTFADQELANASKEVCDNTILVNEFDKYGQDKKLTKKLAKEYDFFIAQATIMPKVATVFGRILGPRGKMPNPKAGCVVPPNANLKPLYAKLQKTLHISVKKDPLFQCRIGFEDSNEEELIDNILSIYNNIASNLPSENQNIKNVYLKLTMGKAVKIGSQKTDDQLAKEGKKLLKKKEKRKKKK